MAPPYGRSVRSVTTNTSGLGTRAAGRYLRDMRRSYALPFLLLAGCTNAPVAGFMDSCFPSRATDKPKAAPAPLIDVGPGSDDPPGGRPGGNRALPPTTGPIPPPDELRPNP
jgi:hypothetical protein